MTGLSPKKFLAQAQSTLENAQGRLQAGVAVLDALHHSPQSVDEFNARYREQQAEAKSWDWPPDDIHEAVNAYVQTHVDLVRLANELEEAEEAMKSTGPPLEEAASAVHDGVSEVARRMAAVNAEVDGRLLSITTEHEPGDWRVLIGVHTEVLRAVMAYAPPEARAKVKLLLDDLRDETVRHDRRISRLRSADSQWWHAAQRYTEARERSVARCQEMLERTEELKAVVRLHLEETP